MTVGVARVYNQMCLRIGLIEHCVQKRGSAAVIVHLDEDHQSVIFVCACFRNFMRRTE